MNKYEIAIQILANAQIRLMEHGWTQGTIFARNAAGEEVLDLSAGAVKWSLVGAIDAEKQLFDAQKDLVSEAFKVAQSNVAQAITDAFGIRLFNHLSTISHYNDRTQTTLAGVVSILDQAICLVAEDNVREAKADSKERAAEIREAIRWTETI
jgi:hypothetical protein